MQLKRDTGYALKILIELADVPENRLCERKMTIRDIVLKTGVPRQIAERLCQQLAAVGFIQKELENGNKEVYVPAPGLPDVTLLDVIKAIEGQTDLFAVFDKNGELFEKYRKILTETSDKLSEELKKLSIKRILTWEHQTDTVI